MSINLGLDGLRKAVIRANLYIDELPGRTRDLGDAMVQQRIALKAATQTSDVNQRHRKEGLKLSQERLQQIGQQQAGERRQKLNDGLSHVARRYQAGQAVVEKVSSVSSRAMSVATSGVRLLRPGYQRATAAQPDALRPGDNPTAAQSGQPLPAGYERISPPGSDPHRADDKPGSRPLLPGPAQASAAGSVTLPPATGVVSVADNLAGDIARLNEAIDGISLSVFTPLNDTLRSLTQTATGLVMSFDQWIQDNPVLAGGIIQLVAAGGLLLAALGGIGSVVVPVLSGLNLLIVGAGVLGTIFTFVGGAIVAALGAITAPIAVVIGAVVGAALLIYKYWEPLGAFFGGVAAGLGQALSPLTVLFEPVLAGFSSLNSFISQAFDRLKAILTPIQSTADQMNALSDIGKLFGQSLVAAFAMPLETLRRLRTGVMEVLETLGIIDKKESEQPNLPDHPDRAAPWEAPVDDASARAQPVGQNPPTLPETLTPGGRPWQPLVAPGVNTGSQQNTFNSHYVINMHEGMTQNDVLALVENNRQQEQFAVSVKQRSSVWGQ